jgi:hypothetical protein
VFSILLIEEVGKDFLGYSANLITILILFIMWQYEFQCIGNNIEEKKNEKPSIFIFMAGISKGVMALLTRLSNKACKITPLEDEEEEIKDNP